MRRAQVSGSVVPNRSPVSNGGAFLLKLRRLKSHYQVRQCPVGAGAGDDDELPSYSVSRCTASGGAAMPVPLCRSKLPAQTTPAVGAGVANLMGSGFSRSGFGGNDREEDSLLLPVIPVPALSTLRLSKARPEPFAALFGCVPELHISPN